MMPNPFAPPFPAAAWAEEDAAKSKLCLEDMRADAFAGPSTEWWPDIDIWDFSGEKPKKVKQSTKMYVQAYYRIPYWSLDGAPLELMYSRKVKYKDDAPAEARKNKYVRSSALYAGYEASVPYFHPQRLDNKPAPLVDIHEGEKKAACAAVACGQQAIGIGGNWSWVDPEHKRTKKLHPWIKQDIARVQAQFPDQRVRVRLWPDGDFRTNSDVRDGYAALVSALRALDVEIVLMDLNPIRAEGKFDDLVAELGEAAVMSGVAEVDPGILPETPELLAQRYGLVTQPLGKGDAARHLPQALFYNFDVLLSRYPKFTDKDGNPLIWLDEDRQKAMLGDSELEEGVGNLEVLAFFQHHLGFNGSRTATQVEIDRAIGHQLKSNRRSPFRDRVQSAARSLKAAGPAAIQAADEALSTWVLTHLGALDTEFNREWGRKFLLAVVGRAVSPGSFLRTAFVMAGPQGIGKSTVMECIVGKSNVAQVNETNSNQKDLPMTYGTCFVAVHDEMAAMTKRSQAQTKSDISRTADNYRQPYAKANTDHPRKCVFFIPVDKHEFLLEDAAGNARFAVLDLHESHTINQKFDFNGLTAAADDLLGAALLAVQSGEDFATVKGAEESAKSHFRVDLEQDQIERLICSADFRPMLRFGQFNRVEVVGLKLLDLVNHGAGRTNVGRGSEHLTGPLAKLGFKNSGDTKVVGFKKTWWMDRDRFDELFELEPSAKHDPVWAAKGATKGGLSPLSREASEVGDEK